MHAQQPQPAIDDDGKTAAVRYNTPLAPSYLRRRNSIATSTVVPTKLRDPAAKKRFHTYSFPSGASPPLSLDFDLAYTSLKDILPPPSATASAVSSSIAATNSRYEFSIRHRLVKQMSNPPRSSGPGLIHRLWLRFSAPVNACLGFISRAVNRILRTVRHHQRS